METINCNDKILFPSSTPSQQNLKPQKKRQLSEQATSSSPFHQQNLSKRVCIKSLVNPQTPSIEGSTDLSSSHPGSADDLKSIAFPNTTTKIGLQNPAPSTMSLNKELEKKNLARLSHLYEISCSIIQNIWPNHSVSKRAHLCSLKAFVIETHQQSRLGITILEIALYYLIRAKPQIQARRKLAQTVLASCLNTKKDNEVDSSKKSFGTSEATPNFENTQVEITVGTPKPSNDNSSECWAGATLNQPPSLNSFTGIPDQPIPAQAFLNQSNFNRFNSTNTYRKIPTVPSNTGTPHLRRSHTSSSINQAKMLSKSSGSLLDSYLSQHRESHPTIQFHPSDSSLNSLSAVSESTYEDDLKLNEQENLKKMGVDVTRCGRRMFVAALICAAKFALDISISNKAWHKITNLPPRQLANMETSFLELLDYKLFLSDTIYRQWSTLLQLSVATPSQIVIPDCIMKKLSSSYPILPNTSQSISQTAPAPKPDNRAFQFANKPVPGYFPGYSNCRSNSEQKRFGFSKEHGLLRQAPQSQYNPYMLTQSHNKEYSHISVSSKNNYLNMYHNPRHNSNYHFQNGFDSKVTIAEPNNFGNVTIAEGCIDSASGPVHLLRGFGSH
ncbi:hypothetical protein BB559_002323 [Furculomyces boomerangus]|uniref:Cyclin N-terminal domain-containing protein n=1 Tax=Furculomyces boomerangus TaxID=61424 RepID=A0A2T9YWC1_9FUNG|nr:hypothetical protein BB559_002323 [Furculomyces boomerangus]